MKFIQFAVASIVDANTGYGYSQVSAYPDYAAAESRGRAIRARSVVEFLEALGQRVENVYAKLKLQAQQRRELAELNRLNDRLLRDIGLSRADLFAVEMGSTTLEHLYAERRSRLDSEAVSVVSKLPMKPRAEASNQDYFAEAKCA